MDTEAVYHFFFQIIGQCTVEIIANLRTETV